MLLRIFVLASALLIAAFAMPSNYEPYMYSPAGTGADVPRGTVWAENGFTIQALDGKGRPRAPKSTHARPFALSVSVPAGRHVFGLYNKDYVMKERVGMEVELDVKAGHSYILGIPLEGPQLALGATDFGYGAVCMGTYLKQFAYYVHIAHCDRAEELGQ